MNCEEKTKKENLVYKGRILDLYNDDVSLADGSESKREYVHHNGGCGVLAVDEEGYVYLVEQYRYPYREMLLEMPAGKLDVGERPYDCAMRELREETGLIADDLIDLGVYYPSPGYTDEPLHIFIALSFTQGKACLDEHELLNLKKIKLQDAMDMIENNTIRDAKTVIALLRYSALNK